MYSHLFSKESDSSVNKGPLTFCQSERSGETHRASKIFEIFREYPTVRSDYYRLTVPSYGGKWIGEALDVNVNGERFPKHIGLDEGLGNYF